MSEHPTTYARLGVYAVVVLLSAIFLPQYLFSSFGLKTAVTVFLVGENFYTLLTFVIDHKQGYIDRMTFWIGTLSSGIGLLLSLVVFHMVIFL